MGRHKKKQFIPAKGARLKKRDAQIVGEEIDALMAVMGGEVTPEDIVETARPQRSRLHQFFDWDNSTAAENWRLQQARHLIAHVCEVRVIGKKQEAVRSYANVKIGNENKYVQMDVVLETPAYAQQLIDEAVQYIEHLNTTLKLLRTHVK